jgi:hypothetical protein
MKVLPDFRHHAIVRFYRHFLWFRWQYLKYECWHDTAQETLNDVIEVMRLDGC